MPALRTFNAFVAPRFRLVNFDGDLASMLA